MDAPLPIPALPSVTPWKASEISDALPPLPPILKPDLEVAVFRHPGLGDGGPSYERLEWLGDAYIELISTALIFGTFPLLVGGRCSQLREELVRNITLAKYFREYGLLARAKLPVDIQKQEHDISLKRGSSRDKDIVKIQADMFEAYLAAVILSDAENGLQNGVAWVKALWGREIRVEIDKVERGNALLPPPGKVLLDSQAKQVVPKERLARLIVVKGVRLDYRDMPNNKRDRRGHPIFSVGVYLDGWGEKNKLLGVGSGQGKKEAGQRAAAVALENKKLMNIYEAKKKASVEAQAAVSAAAAAAEAEQEKQEE